MTVSDSDLTYLRAVEKAGFTPVGWLYTNVLDGYVERGLMTVDGSGTYRLSAAGRKALKEVDHWHLQAAQWDDLGPPLRPAPEDVRAILSAVPASATRVLVLGVTPELLWRSWPLGVSVTAADRCPQMIAKLAPSSLGTVVCCDWRSMPFPDGSFDAVVGDGCLTSLGGPGDLASAVSEIRRVLRPGGVFSHRFFVRPGAPEQDVAESVLSGSVRNFHVAKWRFVMSLCGPDGRVRLGDVWRAWEPHEPRAKEIWSARAVDTMRAYQGSESVYHFPTLDELPSLMTGLVRESCWTPGYELGDRCPIFDFRRS